MWSKAFSRGDAATRSQTVSGPIGDKERSGPGTARGSASCFLLAAGVALGLGLAGCVNISKNTGMPLEFEAAERPATADEFPNWPYPPKVIESRLPMDLDAMDFEVVSNERTAQGTTGARVLKLTFPEAPGERKKVRFKWKEMPRKTTADTKALEAHNDSPRRQIAAYQVQKLFLDPEDYVVPTSLAFCVPLALHGKDNPRPSEPTLPGSNCVLGLIQVWLLDVESDDSLYEEARFVSDSSYAYYLANFNLFTYLIDFADPTQSNFMVSKEPNRRQVFAFDNDISFEEFFRLPFIARWNVIFVSALRRESIERLRKLRREDLDRFGVVAQLQKDKGGIYRSVPPGENLSPNTGVRISGDSIQLGLNKFEIEAVWKRIQNLLARVDKGEIPLI